MKVARLKGFLLSDYIYMKFYGGKTTGDRKISGSLGPGLGRGDSLGMRKLLGIKELFYSLIVVVVT